MEKIDHHSQESVEGVPPIIELTPEMWQKFKKVRLRAAETDLTAWGAGIKDEAEKDEQYWRDKLSNPTIKMFTIDKGNEIVSMAGLQEKPGGKFLLRRVYTVPEAQRQGLGRALVNRVIEEAKRRGAAAIELDVVEEALPAIHLYTSLGFVETKREPVMKGDGKIHNRIFMKKELV